MTVNLSIKSLKSVIVSYLAIPFFVFFIAWLKPIFAIPLCLILMYCFVQYIKKISNKEFIQIPVIKGVISTIIVFCWVGISGNGGMGVQWNDLIKPVAISKDIILNGNPILYQEAANGEWFFLCQYMAFYITIPTVFGFLPWEIVMFVSFIYVFIGAMLGLIWFWHLSGSFSPFVTLFFVFFCGIDFVGFAYSSGFKNALLSLKNDFFAYQPFWGNTLIDTKMPFLYQSNTHSLFWGPQHALSSWIGMGLFLHDFLNKKDLESSPFYLALLVFWSPFIVIGIAPFLLYAAFQKGIIRFFSINNILMIPIVFMVVWYMSSLPLSTIKSSLIFYKAERMLGYLQQIRSFLIFWLADVGVWMIPVMVFYFKSKETRWRELATLCIIVLTLVPLYRFGSHNDWSQRVSMPALFLTSIFVIRIFKESKLTVKIYLFFVFCAAAWDPIYFVSNSLNYTNGMISFKPNSFKETPTYYEACKMSHYPIYQNVAPVSASFYRIACNKNSVTNK